MANFGSFGAGLDMNNIKAAIERRQTGGNMPVGNQISGSTPMQEPSMEAQPAPNVDSSPIPRSGLQGARQSNQQAGGGEREIILKALTQRLSTLNKMDDPTKGNNLSM